MKQHALLVVAVVALCQLHGAMALAPPVGRQLMNDAGGVLATDGEPFIAPAAADVLAAGEPFIAPAAADVLAADAGEWIPVPDPKFTQAKALELAGRVLKRGIQIPTEPVFVNVTSRASDISSQAVISRTVNAGVFSITFSLDTVQRTITVSVRAFGFNLGGATLGLSRLSVNFGVRGFSLGLAANFVARTLTATVRFLWTTNSYVLIRW